jgi:hypothetical protein
MTVFPVEASLTLATFAALISTTAHVVVQPSPVSLNLTAYAPTLVASGVTIATPDTASLSLTSYAPAGGATGVVGYPSSIFDIDGNMYKRVTTTKYIKL